MIPVFDKTAPYIWAAYGISVIGLIVLVIAVIVLAGRAKAALARLEAMEKDEGS